MATQPVTSPLEQPLTYKTWVLKVSIHCEGCKRKVKKVLHSVEGVYTVNVDTKQQKAVVTGNVALAADTLIKKLVKSGKHAEMWPEIAEQREKSNKSKKKEKEKEKEKAKEKEKETDSESSSEEEGGGGHGGPNKPKQTVKFEVVHGEAGGAPAKTSEGGGRSVRFSDSIQVVELKSEGNKPETGTPGNNPPAAEKKAIETDGGAEKSGGGGGSGSGSGSGSGGKKKKKKGHNKSAAGGGPSSGGAPASTGSANSNAGPQPVNYSPPPHHGHQYSPPPGPSHYYAPPASVYVASHGMANPTSSYTTSYYASQPVHSYTHTYHGPETEPPPFDLDYYPQQPLDSFELFSDENPNGCSVM